MTKSDEPGFCGTAACEHAGGHQSSKQRKTRTEALEGGLGR